MKPAFLQTNKKSSFKTWLFKLFMNWYPMFFGTGGKILFISSDWQEVHLRLKLNMWTYNYVGTIFGGSFFSASDPFYMIMVLRNLGNDFVVWDKSAFIRFRRPAKQKVYAKYLLNDELIEDIRQEALSLGETERVFTVQWVDKEGTVYSELERTVYIANKVFYKEKLAKRKALTIS